MPDLLVFHIVFGKSVPDISHNATANLGYADVRFLRPVYPGDTLVAESEVIGLREVSSGEAGVVYVRTRGTNQKGQEVLSFVRWVMIPKRDKKPRRASTTSRTLPAVVTAGSPAGPRGDEPAAVPRPRVGDPPTARWDDYEVGERLDHPDAMTIEEADHVQATRLYHNSAQVHFDRVAMARVRFGKRLVYGGHVISVALALVAERPRHRAADRGVERRRARRPDVRAATRCARSREVVERAEVPSRARRRCAAAAAVRGQERQRGRARERVSRCCRGRRSRGSCSSSTTGRCCRAPVRAEGHAIQPASAAIAAKRDRERARPAAACSTTRRR